MERRTWLLLAVVGLLLGVFHAARGGWWTALLTVAVIGAMAWWTSPWRGGRGGLSHAGALAAGRPVTVSWRARRPDPLTADPSARPQPCPTRQMATSTAAPSTRPSAVRTAFLTGRT